VSERATPPNRAVPAHRKPLRLPDYDYAQAGVYLVTAVAFRRACLFGAAREGGVGLNDIGRIVASCWLAIPEHFPHIALDEWVVMPNHIHGLMVLREGGLVTVGNVVGLFKSSAARQFNAARGGHTRLWQRGYYEHVVRSEEALSRIREYLVNNPVKWDLDDENPERKRATR